MLSNNRKTGFISRFFLTVIFNIGWLAATAAHYTPTAGIEQAYSDMLKLKIAQAQKQIRAEIAADPQNHLAVYIEDYADFFVLAIDENPDTYQKIKHNEDIRLKKIRSGDKGSPYYYFLQAEIKLHWAVIKLRFGDDFSAITNLYQAWNLLDECVQRFPTFVPARKSFGILQILVSNVPENYQWVCTLAGMSASFDYGQKLLNDAITVNNFFKEEAYISHLYMQAYLYKKEKEILSETATYCEKNNDNLLMAFLYSQILIKAGKNDDALTLLKDFPNRSQYLAFHYLNYKIGESYLFKNEYASAVKYLDLFTENYKGQNYLKAAYYKKALVQHLQNNHHEAELLLEEVKAKGVKKTEEDKTVHDIAVSKKMPHPLLAKARLYYDGSYFKEAKTVLNVKDDIFASTTDKAEFHYRLARILEAQKETTEAIDEYKKVIRKYVVLNRYFAPNSALQLGYIYSESQRDSSEYYFRKAISYKKHEYKNSIDARAKAGLNMLKKKNP